MKRIEPRIIDPRNARASELLKERTAYRLAPEEKDAIATMVLEIRDRVYETQCKPAGKPPCKHYNPYSDVSDCLFPCCCLPDFGEPGFGPEKGKPWRCANCEPEDEAIWKFMQEFGEE